MHCTAADRPRSKWTGSLQELVSVEEALLFSIISEDMVLCMYYINV